MSLGMFSPLLGGLSLDALRGVFIRVYNQVQLFGLNKIQRQLNCCVMINMLLYGFHLVVDESREAWKYIAVLILEAKVSFGSFQIQVSVLLPQ